jgi:S1-C subfamily serine protease
MSRGSTLFRSAGKGVTFAVALCALAACGQVPVEEQPKPLTTISPAKIGLELIGTGFFVDRDGHVLTAGHAAADCVRLFVRKDGRTLRAKALAVSAADDLALLEVENATGVPAVFARSLKIADRDMAFAADYRNLPGILAGGGALSNAVLTGNKTHQSREDIELVSAATHGSSGAPVLNAMGQVIGLITHKLRSDRVLATNANQIKVFLAANRIAVAETDQPQLNPLQDHARQAAAISVGVTCFK